LADLRSQDYQVLLAEPGADRPPLDALFADWSPRPLALLVGPEGGFDATELSLAEAAGGQVFSWGSRVLRAETACVVLSALVLHEAEKALRHI
jgi:16S rRNA (uracil1498-N3)-methyltransferase